MRFLKLILFQLKLYVKNSYFVNLVLIETTMMLLYEYLSKYISQDYTGLEWLVAGIMGTWASCTTSAGALGYQRFQGTLMYLLNTAIPREEVLLATLSPAALYGLVAFPLAGIESLILRMPLKYVDWQLLLGIILFWLASVVLSYFISLFFLLIRNAMQYEQLVLLPILLLSGMLAVPSSIENVIRPFQLLSPLSLPIRTIYHQSISTSWICSYILIIIFFFVLAILLTNYVVQKAFKEGRLNIF
ncbi:ABC-2 type transport system permease protein [Lactobacillus colini]|uniref:ABC-2 type transport system permease protein n=1 Tax=Lactobacillus colini TaxID=1819254 RepID=A0ABS4MGA0_9LACO|nr:ABC transporter permease [Lactobacillus colini]MBP2058725.1 ABC-2 type transport system permease protein [Lactobacillus colini]